MDHNNNPSRRIEPRISFAPSAGAVGVVIWENENSDDRTLVSLSRNFYERIAKKNPYPIEIVCDGCGAAQPENRLERPSANRSAES